MDTTANVEYPTDAAGLAAHLRELDAEGLRLFRARLVGGDIQNWEREGELGLPPDDYRAAFCRTLPDGCHLKSHARAFSVECTRRFREVIEFLKDRRGTLRPYHRGRVQEAPFGLVVDGFTEPSGPWTRGRSKLYQLSFDVPESRVRAVVLPRGDPARHAVEVRYRHGSTAAHLVVPLFQDLPTTAATKAYLSWWDDDGQRGPGTGYVGTDPPGCGDNKLRLLTGVGLKDDELEEARDDFVTSVTSEEPLKVLIREEDFERAVTTENVGGV